MASRLVWHTCSCRAQRGEAEGLHCSGDGLGFDDLAQHLTPGAAVEVWQRSPSPAWDAGTLHMGCLPSSITF